MEVKNYSPQYLHHVLGNFSIAAIKLDFEPLTSGLINDTYLVYTGGTPTYILQRINERVFTNVDGLMKNCSKALTQLKAPDYTKIELVKTKEGQNYFKGPDYFWRLVSYIPETITYDTTDKLPLAFEVGRILGSFQKLLQHQDPNNYVDTIPNFHNLDLRVKQFEEALVKAPKHKLDECGTSIAFVKSTAALLQENIPQNLPVRVCHNDTKLNNILFSKQTNKALCLIDLDTIMKGHFMFDFGDAIRTVVNPAKEDEQQLSIINFRSDFFEAFVQGLASNAHIWTKKELQSLPFGAVLMPFLHGLRALTDYLDGNTYYKVSYEKQNFDRALSLFQFTKKALEHLSFMDQTLTKYFPVAHSK